jgi:putative addiction module killer protein
VEYYASPRGESPFTDWLESIKDLNTVQRIRHRIERFELGNLGDYKPIRGTSGFFEAR